MDDDSVDAVVVVLVVVELEGSFVVDITGDVDSRSVNDLSHEPFSVANDVGDGVIGQALDEEWHEVAVSVDDVVVNGVGAGSDGFSKYDCAWGASGPPGVAVDDVIGDGDIV